jgi:Carboxypeptidase regulatory-like domain
MRIFRFQSAILALTLAVVIGSLAFVDTPAAIAQITSAAIHGTVTDPSGAVVPDAKVTALNTSTGISTETTSNKSGYFLFPELQVGGPYTVTVSASGFESFVANGLTLNVNDNREVLATMTVGGTAQTVQVTATALQVETSNTQLQQIITADQLENVPMEGRDAAGLQKFEAGSVESSDRFGTYSSNGSQTPQNDVILDGADNNDGALQDEGIIVNPDALQEENIVTSTMNPEFSRNSGAIVNEVLKSGTNSIHGEGFEYYRDTFMNNANYFSPVDPTNDQKIRPIFHQNLYGGTLGGPIFKNKLFLFAAYQGDRNATSTTAATSTFSGTNGSTPTGNFAGDFTDDPNWADGFAPNSAGLTGNPIPFAIGSCPKGEAWNVCFPGATVVIPPGEWNSIASNLIKKYVLASNSSNGLYEFNSPNTGASDQGILRADWTPSAKDTIWGSAIVQSNPSANALSFGGGTFPGFGQHASSHFKIFNGSYTHTFGPTLLNELHGNYYRFNYPSVIPTPVQTPSSLGFDINPQLAQSGIPFMAVGNDFDLGNSYEGPQPRLDTNLTYADNLTWIRGNHSLKFGALYEQFRVHNPFGYLNNGYYYYEGGLGGGGLYSSGDPLIDFAMGIPDGYEQTNDGFIDALSSETFAYFQDNWKVSPDFTFNYGTSWDIEQPTQDKQYNGLGIDCFSVSNQTSKVFPGGPPGLTFKGDPGCNEAGGPTTHWDRLGPRVGIAWSPSSGPSALVGANGAHSFSIRAGFGLYYNRDQEEQSLQNLLDPPSLLENTGAAEAICTTGPFAGFPCVPGFANPFQDVAGNGGIADPFPFTTPAPGSALNWVGEGYYYLTLNAFATTYIPPYTYNFNVNIQRELGSHYRAQIGYVGSLSHRLPTWNEGDPITAAGHASCLANPTCAGNPGSVHLYFPQYTAQPALAPGSGGYPWYASVGQQNSEGASNYNSFQASLLKAMDHGLQFSLAYTYSHALDDGSGYESTTGSGSSAYGNYGRARTYVPGFEQLNYGSSDFDARQRLAATYVYSVPVAGFLRNNLIMREALAGWGLSGVTALQTGFPVGISTGADQSLWCDGGSKFQCLDNPNTSNFNIARYNARKIQAPSAGVQAGNSGNYYFNTAPFSEEAIGTFGNTGRNFFRGPGFNYTNLSVTKNFPFSADNSRFVQLRLEGYNVFNHTNFGAPSGILSSPTFGQVTSVIEGAEGNGDPSPGRAVQLAGKIYF